MSLKQSCFKAQIKSDMKRLWWMSALATLFMFLFTTVPLIDYLKFTSLENFDDRMLYYDGGATTWLLQRLEQNYIFALILGGALSLGLFSYLTGVSSVTFNHSLPVKRNTLLAAHSVSALVFIAIPVIVNAVICVPVVWRYCSIKAIFINMGIYFVYALLMYVIFTFVGMLTGNTAAHGIFSVIFILLPLFITSFILTLCDSYLYGFVSGGILEDILGKFLYLLPESLMGPKVIVYVLLIAVFYLLSMFVYNKRHLENYGEVIAFPRLKWLFKLSFGVCSGILGYYYCQAFWNVENILVMIVFGTLGVIIANMLSNKSFSLKGSKLPILYNAIVVLLLFVIFNFDITGFESRVPDIDDVVKVTNASMQSNGHIYGYIDDEHGYDSAYRTEVYNMSFTNKRDIQMFLDFHKKKIENKDVELSHRAGRISGIPYNIRLEYTLKNGRKMTRQYVISDSDIESFVKPFMESSQYKKFQYPILDGTQKEYTTVKVFWECNKPEDNTIGIFAGNSKELKSIVEALKLDAENMSFEQCLARHNGTPLYRVEVSYKVPAKKDDGKEVWIEDQETYNVNVFDKNTLKALEEAGCITQDTVINADKVEKIIVHPEGVYLYDDFGYSYVEPRFNYDEYKEMVDVEIAPVTSSSKFGEFSREFTSREDIEALYNYFLTRTLVNPFDLEKYAFFSYEIHFTNGYTCHYSMYDAVENLPSIISFVGKYSYY